MPSPGPGKDSAVSSTHQQILRTYVLITLLSTFAASFIWGINTLFLLDARLSVTEAFFANAFFTLGQVIFEVPTGVVADTLGRRRSYLLGSATLFGATLLYLWLWKVHGPFWAWAVVSALLGLGFTFFSGATEAWLVDGLTATGYSRPLDTAFAKGQIAGGVAMLTGTIAGGVIAQHTNLGVPYILRAVMLALTFIVAALSMHDIGFTPKKHATVRKAVGNVLTASIHHGFGKPPVRWMMLAAPLGAGVGFYAFYAMQPYLLERYGKGQSYAIAGLAAATVAGMQIVGGLLSPLGGKIFSRRTSLLIAALVMSAGLLGLVGFVTSFGWVLALFAAWALVFATSIPARQAYLNGLIPSSARATVLSFDNLLSSSGGVAVQPLLGKVADASSYGISYMVGAGIELLCLPFLLLARKENATSDVFTIPPDDGIQAQEEPPPSTEVPPARYEVAP